MNLWLAPRATHRELAYGLGHDASAGQCRWASHLPCRGEPPSLRLWPHAADVASGMAGPFFLFRVARLPQDLHSSASVESRFFFEV